VFLISRSNGFAFFHVPKTGGTSIAGALGLHAAVPAMRTKPRRQLAKGLAAEGLPDAVLDLSVHAKWRDVEACVGREVLESLFTFGFVRNPFDLELSWFTYCQQNASHPGHDAAKQAKTFPNYARTVLAERPPHDPGYQENFLCDGDGSIPLSFVGRFESLADDVAQVFSTLGFPLDEMPHFNQSYHAPWPSEYDPETAAIVRALHRRDFDVFGYDDDI